MLTGLQVDAYAADLKAGECEGIQNFTRWPRDIAIGETVVMVVGVVATTRQIGVRVSAALIDIVIPTGGAQAEAVLLLPRDIKFGNQVYTVGNHVTLIELMLRIVIERRIIEIIVAPLHSPAGVVTNGIVPTHTEIRIACLDF